MNEGTAYFEPTAEEIAERYQRQPMKCKGVPLHGYVERCSRGKLEDIAP